VPHNLLDGSIDQDTVAGSPSKGDLIVGNGSSPSLWTTFSPGSDSTVLIADSAQTNGLRWGGAPASHPLLDGSVDNDTDAHTPAAGDMIYAHGSPVKWDGLAFGSNGQVLRGVSGAPAWSNDDKTVVIAIDGGGSAIVAPWQSAPIYLPYGLTLTSVEIGADQSGSCQFDVWYSVSGVPTSSNSIVASDPPKLNSQQTSSDSALTGWTTSLAAGGWMIVKLSSASVVTKLVMVLAGKHS
ncbi:MAG TPA: hypothetical protein VKT32_01425, partial [Chthonomonadaceae bacterium]|nr:hypothetical protein [Chthonomonadaceae bacterium]